MTDDSAKPFPVTITVPVLWGDMDAMGHVNNIVHFRWFESARIAYLERVGLNELMKAERIGPILASTTCNYRRQIIYPDTIQAGASVVRVGRSSMTLSHQIFSTTQGEVVANGESTVVVFDFQRQKPVRVPAEFRKTVEELEGRCPE